jgi:hypothetical protein
MRCATTQTKYCTEKYPFLHFGFRRGVWFQGFGLSISLAGQYDGQLMAPDETVKQSVVEAGIDSPGAL